MLDQFFCIHLVHCVHMKAERPILAKNTFKIDISILQLLGLERTLLSELPHISLFKKQNDCHHHFPLQSCLYQLQNFPRSFFLFSHRPLEGSRSHGMNICFRGLCDILVLLLCWSNAYILDSLHRLCTTKAPFHIQSSRLEHC